MVRNSHVYNLFFSSQLVSPFSHCPGGIFLFKPCTVVQSGGTLIKHSLSPPLCCPQELTLWLDSSTFSSLFQTVLLLTEYTRLLMVRWNVKKLCVNLPVNCHVPEELGERDRFLGILEDYQSWSFANCIWRSLRIERCLPYIMGGSGVLKILEMKIPAIINTQTKASKPTRFSMKLLRLKHSKSLGEVYRPVQVRMLQRTPSPRLGSTQLR